MRGTHKYSVWTLWKTIKCTLSFFHGAVVDEGPRAAPPWGGQCPRLPGIVSGAPAMGRSQLAEEGSICVHHLFQACGTKHLIRALTSWFPIWSNYDLHMWLYTQYICTSFLHFANSQMLIKASIKLFILTLERLNLFNAVITGQTFIYRYYI